jgi:metal-dependent amidase/aminoacylase/carboxypeptidase family protein
MIRLSVGDRVLDDILWDIDRAGRQYLPQMTEWRRHIHAHPETAFEEVDTARYVADRLRSFGVDESARRHRQRPVSWA